MSEQITLMYHDVLDGNTPKSGFQKVGAIQYTINAEALVQQLKYAVGMDNVQYTFDDGGTSFYTVIADLLEKYGRKGIFFIAASYIGTPFFMTAEQIKELDRRGHTIASHSHTHPKKISALSKEQCLAEWTESKDLLEVIVGHEVNTASVPGGAVSKMVIDCMVEAGYTQIYTSEPTTKTENKGTASVYGRFGVKGTTTFEQYKNIISDQKVRAKMLRNHKVLGLAKRVLGSQYNNLKQVILKIKRG